jgi:acetoacetyl-CoA synthetase
MEVPVRKLLLGSHRGTVASDDAMVNPRSLDFFERFARERERLST